MRKGRTMALLPQAWAGVCVTESGPGDTFYTGISFILEPRFYNKVSLFNLHIITK